MFNLPNLLTLSNLFLGCCAVLLILRGQPEWAAWCTLGSFLCDYADGMVARALKISGPLGKELDSLADVVSFGVVPSMMIYQMLANDKATGGGQAVAVAALPSFVLAAFSALRLAKFNLDTRQTSYFLGLSTPACTVFVLGLSLGMQHNRFGIGDFLQQQAWLIYVLIPILCALLISEIPMFGLKIKRFDLKSNLINVAFLGLLAFLANWLRELALSLVIVIYIIASIFLRKKITG
jgi:CDP-diacylglycerol---serine O-phosphatidyltransferase